LNHLIVHPFFVSESIGTTNQEADPGHSGLDSMTPGHFWAVSKRLWYRSGGCSLAST
jgi:hypothetical protein